MERKGNAEALRAAINLGCSFVEQAALEGGQQFGLAKILTGFPEPPFQATENCRWATGSAFSVKRSRLADPKWVVTNLAYFADLEKTHERIAKTHEKGKTKPEHWRPKPGAGGQEAA